MKLIRILEIAKKRNATVARVLTEIVNDGWKATGRSATRATDRVGLEGFAKLIRGRDFNATVALCRRHTGAPVAVIPLP